MDIHSKGDHLNDYKEEEKEQKEIYLVIQPSTSGEIGPDQETNIKSNESEGHDEASSQSTDHTESVCSPAKRIRHPVEISRLLQRTNFLTKNVLQPTEYIATSKHIPTQFPRNSQNFHQGKKKDHYMPGTDVPYKTPGTNNKNKRGQVKRPMNAYMCWARTARGYLCQKMPSATNADISIKLGEIWSSMTTEQKQPYFDEADLIRRKHNSDFPDYSYQPNIQRRPYNSEPTQYSSAYDIEQHINQILASNTGIVGMSPSPSTHDMAYETSMRNTPRRRGRPPKYEARVRELEAKLKSLESTNQTTSNAYVKQTSANYRQVHSVALPYTHARYSPYVCPGYNPMCQQHYLPYPPSQNLMSPSKSEMEHYQRTQCTYSGESMQYVQVPNEQGHYDNNYYQNSIYEPGSNSVTPVDHNEPLSATSQTVNEHPMDETLQAVASLEKVEMECGESSSNSECPEPVVEVQVESVPLAGAPRDTALDLSARSDGDGDPGGPSGDSAALTSLQAVQIEPVLGTVKPFNQERHFSTSDESTTDSSSVAINDPSSAAVNDPHSREPGADVINEPSTAMSEGSGDQAGDTDQSTSVESSREGVGENGQETQTEAHANSGQDVQDYDAQENDTQLERQGSSQTRQQSRQSMQMNDNVNTSEAVSTCDAENTCDSRAKATPMELNLDDILHQVLAADSTSTLSLASNASQSAEEGASRCQSSELTALVEEARQLSGRLVSNSRTHQQYTLQPSLQGQCVADTPQHYVHHSAQHSAHHSAPYPAQHSVHHSAHHSATYATPQPTAQTSCVTWPLPFSQYPHDEQIERHARQLDAQGRPYESAGQPTQQYPQHPGTGYWCENYDGDIPTRPAHFYTDEQGYCAYNVPEVDLDRSGRNKLVHYMNGKRRTPVAFTPSSYKAPHTAGKQHTGRSQSSTNRTGQQQSTMASYNYTANPPPYTFQPIEDCTSAFVPYSKQGNYRNADSHLAYGKPTQTETMTSRPVVNQIGKPVANMQGYTIYPYEYQYLLSTMRYSGGKPAAATHRRDNV